MRYSPTIQQWKSIVYRGRQTHNRRRLLFYFNLILVLMKNYEFKVQGDDIIIELNHIIPTNMSAFYILRVVILKQKETEKKHYSKKKNKKIAQILKIKICYLKFQFFFLEIQGFLGLFISILIFYCLMFVSTNKLNYVK